MDLNPKELIKNFDLDGSGTVSEKEIELSKELIEISLREDKSASQKRMAWVAVGSMCIFAVLPLMPFVPASRLDTLASLSDMLFLSQASIVGLYFGATAMMHKK
tara:strand:- start:77 stop:388 length:312 start_codon:yes stop_codon:yes gene_type:complete